jgi:hypothetical protein
MVQLYTRYAPSGSTKLSHKRWVEPRNPTYDLVELSWIRADYSPNDTVDYVKLDADRCCGIVDLLPLNRNVRLRTFPS